MDGAQSSTAPAAGMSNGKAPARGRVVSRRDIFRLNAGPSRKELQWRQIVSVLLKIQAPSVLQSAPQIPSEKGHLGTIYGADDLQALSSELESSRISHQKVEKDLSRSLESNHSTQSLPEEIFGQQIPAISQLEVKTSECGQLEVKSCPERLNESQLNELLDGISWPLDAVGDMGSVSSFEISWENVPESADPVRGSGYKVGASGSQDEEGGSTCMGRGQRKRLQVQNVASALSSFDLEAGSTIVDFGCGSGALMLPLAALFPEFSFVGVDFKQHSINLLLERARKGNLQNVVAYHERIESYCGPMDVCVALHACGIATDLALLQALNRRAAYVVSPCCVGKLKVPIQTLLKTSARHMQPHYRFGSDPSLAAPESTICSFPPKNFVNHSRSVDANEIPVESVKPKLGFKGSESGSPQDEAGAHCRIFPLIGSTDRESLNLVYPRSRWLRSSVTENEFQVLARAADWSSYDHESSVSRLHSLCKVVVEIDRNEASRESGFWTQLFSLSNENAGTVGVSHILVGRPQ